MSAHPQFVASEHLEKAKGALAHAADLPPRGSEYQELLVIAQVQAQIAQAEALEHIARLFELWATPVRYVINHPGAPIDVGAGG